MAAGAGAATFRGHHIETAALPLRSMPGDSSHKNLDVVYFAT
jgi:hypothetical protein